MLTNDNNLSVKACANGLSTWSSLDFICKLHEAIPELDRFISKDLRELSPHPQQLFEFCIELFMSALRFRLKQQDQLTSNNNGIVYRLIEKVKEQKIPSDTQLMTRCECFIRECRKKGRGVAREDVMRLLRFVCAILETLKSDKIIAKLLNVCKGIFAGLKACTPRAKTGATLTSSIVGSKEKKGFESMSDAQKKHVVEIVKEVDTKRKKTDGIRKNTARRKKPSIVNSCDSDNDCKMDTDEESTPAQMNTVDKAPAGSSTNLRSSSRRLSANSDMEVDSISKRPRQAFGPLVGEDIKQHPVYQMLETVWFCLHNISGKRFHSPVVAFYNAQLLRIFSIRSCEIR